MLTRNFADGEVSAADRDYLVALVAERTGQTPEAAGAAVDATVAEARAFYAEAVDAAEQARKAAAIGGFVIAATLMASAAAACLAAASGGDHRDRNVLLAWR